MEGMLGTAYSIQAHNEHVKCVHTQMHQQAKHTDIETRTHHIP